MRWPLLLLLCVPLVQARAQDPDQQAYWTRYTFVEDSSALTPLQGDYQVYYLQSGMWWTYMPSQYPVRALPEKGMRLLPLFGPGSPAFMSTPARGIELPDVKLVVVRGQDTLVVELSSYYEGMGSLVNERCKTLDCTRRPPLVLPFRPGRYLPTGIPFAHETNGMVDARTISLTAQFDALWAKAMKEGRVIPQLNTDTCTQELVLPPDIDLPETKNRDAWVMRSAYCGKHFLHFPMLSARTEYRITFIPYGPEGPKDPLTLSISGTEDLLYWVDVSSWPIGDHPVQLVDAGDNAVTFTLKLR